MLSDFWTLHFTEYEHLLLNAEEIHETMPYMPFASRQQVLQ